MINFENPEKPKDPSLETEETEQTIENEAIAKLEVPMKKLLGAMREKINAGTYGLLIGDDASGRIPTLAFREILGRISPSEEQGNPDTLFFAGTRYSSNKSDKELKKKIQGLEAELKNHEDLKEKNQDVLVITDTIASGESLTPLLNVLQSLNLPFDIATIGLLSGWNAKRKLEKKYSSQIFAGDDGTPKIYGKKILAGVTKRVKDVHSQPLKKHPSETLIGGPGKKQKIQDEIDKARQDTHLLAQKLIQWYHETNTED